MSDQAKVKELAQKIWDYHHLNQQLVKADVVLILGSNDIRVANRGAELFKDNWAPLIIISGGRGKLTQDWQNTEAAEFKKTVLKHDINEEKILIEDKSTNTGENIKFTRDLLRQKNINVSCIILVTKPYMERRAYATAKKIWPEMEFIVTSPQIPFNNYPNKDLPRDLIINIMVGDLQRIKVYPGLGYQVYQEVPEDVWLAYEKLVKLGFVKHLIDD